MSITVASLKGYVSMDVSEFLGGLRKADRELDDFEDNVNKKTKDIPEKTKRNLSGMKTALSVAGAGAGAALTMSVFDSMNREASGDKLAASLGLSPEESKRMAGLSAGIFADAWGESADEVNVAIGAVVQNIDGMKNASDEDLRNVTTCVMDLSKTFNQDLGATTRAVGQMMRTGMAKDATEALDIITSGMQNGVNKSDDLMDTMNEYGTQFRKMGIDGKTAMGLMNQAIKGGARDSDVAADAIKELSIRAIDGSKSTISGFKDIGLNAKQMQADFAAGGSRSAGALDLVLDKLRTIKDPAKQAAVATKLLGTQSEDLGKALYSMDVTGAAEGLGQVEGAASKMSETLNENASTQIEGYKRGIQDMGLKLVETTGSFGAIAAAAASFAPGLMQMGGDVANMAGGFGGIAKNVKIATIGTKLWAGATKAAALVQAGFNIVLSANPIGLVVMAIAALAAGIIWAWNNVDWFREGIMKLWEGAKAAFGKILEIVKGVFGWIGENWQNILAILLGPIGIATRLIIGNWDKIKAGAQAILEAIKQHFTNAFNRVKDIISGAIRFITGLWQRITGILTAPIRAAVGLVISNWERIKGAFGAVRDFVVNGAKALFNALTAPWRNGIGLIIGALNALIGMWNGLSFSINTPDIPGTDWGGQSWTWDSPDIPTVTPPSFLQGLATGGTVTDGGAFWVGENGPEIVNLPAGAAVTPNHALGGGSTVNNFYIKSDRPEDVRREIYKVLRTVERSMKK